MERVIRDPMNRSLWWLTVGLGYAVVLSGPLVSAIVFQAIYQVPIMTSLVWLWPINIVAVTIGLIVGAVILHRVRNPLTPVQAVLYAIGVTLVGLVLRFIIIRLTGQGPLPEVQTNFYLIQFAIGAIFLAALIAAISFATVRERALTDLFAQLNRAQISLAQEEEKIRSEVFDQLHGSLQAEFVALRRELKDLSEATTDPRAATVAERVETQLETVYRDGVESIARALYPSGLEVGLNVALSELAGRLEPSISLNIAMDPIVLVLDDPMLGGLHRSLRMASYRIVEEAVSNAVEHSGARTIDVAVTSDLDEGEPHLTLTISHGIAAPVVVREGSGLTRMRSRAHALGGRVSYVSRDSRFIVRAEFPLVRPDEGRWAEAEAGYI
jgi:signal transduction histidine kinase